MFKNLFKAVFIITFFSVLTRIMGFVIRIFMSRELGAEMIGIYQISLSVFSVFLTIISSGIPLTVSRLSAEYRAKKEFNKENKMVTAATIVSFVLAVVICILTIVFRPIITLISKESLIASVLIALLPALIGTALNVGFKGALWGREKHFENCFVDLIEQLIKVILIIILVNISPSIEQGLINCAISLSIACIISTLISMLFYFKHKGKLSNPKGEFKPLIKKSFPITLLRIVSSFGGMIMSVIIPISLVSIGYTNEQAMSLFGIALGMTLPLLYLPNTLVGSLSTALIPDLAKLKAENNSNEFYSKVKSSLIFSIFISLIFIPCFMGIGKEIGIFVYNNETSGIMLEYCAIIMLPMGINNITSSILNSMGLEVKSFIHYVYGSIALILSVIFLPRFFGIYSLAIGLGASLIISSYFNVKMIKKELNIKNLFFKELIKMCLFLIPSILINRWSFNCLINIFTPFFSIAISSILGVIFFVSFCLIFKIFTINGLLINFKNIRILRKKHKKKTV
ncbi:MAG: hypothetical protein E7359_02735 [Clostridiales bacterium]|nr:hypothetical protein [Clostridiales bacterium]